MCALWPRLEREAPGYRCHAVEAGPERTLVDLVAEPVPPVLPPVEVAPGVRVDSAEDILAHALTALVGRSALRDLVEVGALLRAGADLDLALTHAAAKDGGFSPPTLAWVLQQPPIEPLSRSAGADPVPLLRVRTELIARRLQRGWRSRRVVGSARTRRAPREARSDRTRPPHAHGAVG